MAIISIQDVHRGINFKDEPSAIAEGFVREAIGFDIVRGGTISTAPVFTDHDLGSDIPESEINWVEVHEIYGKRYVLVSTESGFYVNGDFISADLIGRFRSTAVMNQIYIVTQSKSWRYDTSDGRLYNLGIEGPTSLPIFSAGSLVYKTIDDFESDYSDWIDNAENCIVSSETTTIKEGTRSIKIALASGTVAQTTKSVSLDLTKLSDGSDSPEDDLVRFWIYVDKLENVNELTLLFDLSGDGFKSNMYAYTFVLPGESALIADTKKDQTVFSSIEQTGFDTSIFDPEQVVFSQDETTTKTIKKTIASGITDSVEDMTYIYWNRKRRTGITSGVWSMIEIPKNFFARYGDDTSLDWSDVKAIRIKIGSIKGVNVYIDDMRIVGGGSLSGDYWFMYAYGRLDSNGSLVNWSSVAKGSDKRVLISGPIRFNRQKVVYSSRPLSSDPQVNCGLVYIIGGNIYDWKLGAIITDNATTNGTLDISETSVYRLGVSFRNEPAPGGLDILYKWGRLWICGSPGCPAGLQCSEITADGDVLLEAWSPINVWIAEGESQLTSLSDIGIQQPMVVRGVSGEYLFNLSDPADISTALPLTRVSRYGLQSSSAKVVIENSEFYPSVNTFANWTGNGSIAVLPEFSSVIDYNQMRDAVGATVGWESYFSFTDSQNIDRLVRIDRYTNQLRVSTLTNRKCKCLFTIPRKGNCYCVYNGRVYKIGSEYNNDSYNFELITRGYTAPMSLPVAWQRIDFEHNTNNQWFRIHVIIDGREIGFWPFRSNRLKRSVYVFGPVVGSVLQIAIRGEYRVPAEIKLPLRVSYGSTGAEDQQT